MAPGSQPLSRARWEPAWAVPNWPEAAAGTGHVGRARSGCRLPGTHGVWGHRGNLRKSGDLSGWWLPLAPSPHPSGSVIQSAQERRLHLPPPEPGGARGWRPPCTSHRSPAATRLHLAAGSSSLWDLSLLGASREAQGQGLAMSRLQDEA